MVNHLFGRMMPSYIKQILHTQLFSVLNIIFGFVTLFVLIKYMQVEEYGEYVLIQGFIAISGLVLSQNIYSYARLKIPGALANVQYGYLKTVIFLVFGLFIFILIILQLFHIQDDVWNFFEIQSSISLFVLFMLGFELINLEFMRFFIAIKKIYLKNYAQFIQKVIVMFGVLSLLYFNELSLLYFLYIYLLGQLFVLTIFLFNVNIKTLISSSFMNDVLKKGYKVAIPLLPIGLMSIALNYTDTLMIAKFIGKNAVAQYGFASQIISIAMMMIGTSIVLTLFPYATEAHNDNNIEQRNLFFTKMFKYGIYLSIGFYIIINLTSTWFVDFLNINEYHNVPAYLMVLGIFPFFQHLYNVNSHRLQLMKIFHIQVYIAIVAIVENIVLNYFMIQKYSVMGAAYASLISYITLALMYTYLVKKYKTKTLEKGNL